MSDEERLRFLIDRINFFLTNGVHKTVGPYSESNNRCKHSKYGWEGCGACVEDFFTETMKVLNEVQMEWPGS